MAYSAQWEVCTMLPRMIRLHPSTYQRLIRLSKEAEGMELIACPSGCRQ